MSENVYETQRLVEEYLLFHYGTPEQVLGWAGGPESALGFPERVAQHFGDTAVARALDIGCSVGRAAYTLSQIAEEVVAIDYSHAFVEAAQKLQQEGTQEISRFLEGTSYDKVTVQRPTSGAPERISFKQGDAMNLPESLGTFDRVLAANLICRLPEPLRFLKRLPLLVRPKGTVVLATPCTWLEEFTPPQHFPTQSTFEWLKGQMQEHFMLEHHTNEPFLIRETARKFQWTVSEVTVWKKKASV